MKNKLFEAKEKFTPTDLSYCGVYIDCDYECDPKYDYDGYHRNSVITNTRITCIDVDKVIEAMLPKEARNNEYYAYYFDRLCRIAEVYDPTNYTVYTRNGYYGQEIDRVEFNKEKDVKESLNMLLALSSEIDCVKAILKAEYGYLLDTVEACKEAEIRVVNVCDIEFPQGYYAKKIKDKDIYKKYSKYPIAICTCKNDRYEVIDGYHRTLAAKENNTSYAKIILLK